jgi:PPP family 3-phenylpropionic acid transporter
VLIASLLLAALRWLMIGFGAASVGVLVLAQCLHAATFGSFHAAGIEFVRRHFGYADQGQGQALYSAISFGAGGALGALGSGWLWDRSQHAVFLLAALGRWPRMHVRAARTMAMASGELARACIIMKRNIWRSLSAPQSRFSLA